MAHPARKLAGFLRPELVCSPWASWGRNPPEHTTAASGGETRQECWPLSGNPLRGTSRQNPGAGVGGRHSGHQCKQGPVRFGCSGGGYLRPNALEFVETLHIWACIWGRTPSNVLPPTRATDSRNITGPSLQWFIFRLFDFTMVQKCIHAAILCVTFSSQEAAQCPAL